MNRQETSRTNACTECAKSKKKCVYDSSSSICLRCREKNKKCLQQVPKTKKSVFELIKHYVMSKLKSTPINELNLIEENDEYYLYLKVKLPQELRDLIKMAKEVEHTPNTPIQTPTVNFSHTVSYPPTNNEIPGTCTSNFQGNYSTETESSDYSQPLYDFPFNTPYTEIFDGLGNVFSFPTFPAPSDQWSPSQNC
ncbi:6668_t:CDS:2 [Gigaspora margarita]|uniref:6668_t:CDS:1 n=1 Tax=Gigaspora margarita TaxID=4874 RepID=A0ABN7UN32_GIGMA|nr:6668_t:CDS:2 [Gigaspora margarita]